MARSAERNLTSDKPRESLVSRFRRNTAAWGIPSRWIPWLLLVPVLPLPLLIASAVAEHPWFYTLSDEDGPVEWLQVAALVLALVLYARLSIRLRRAGRRSAMLLTAFVAVAAFIVAGEEISWGQRILGWSTPEALDAINHQGEFNVHNITSMEFFNRLGQFGASGYATLVPLLALVPPAAAAINRSILVPPLALASWFAIPFVYWLARMPIDPGRPMLRFSEYTELALYVGLALVGWFTVRRLVREADGSHGGDVG